MTDIIKLQSDYDHVKRALKDVNNALQQVVRENNQLRELNERANSKCKMLVESKAFTDQIINDQLNEANRKNNQYLEEIQQLKQENYELKKNLKENGIEY